MTSRTVTIRWLAGAVAVADGQCVQAVVAVIRRTQRRTTSRAGGKRRVEWAEVWAKNFRAAEQGVEIQADDAVSTGPLAQSAVPPDHGVVAVEQHDAVGHLLKNALVLQQLAERDRFAEMRRGDIDGVELLAR